jgi:hypothetical protein
MNALIQFALQIVPFTGGHSQRYRADSELGDQVLSVGPADLDCGDRELVLA